jgi:flavin-dependent dehydrogenase
MIFDRAAELGADCYDQTRVMDVTLDANGAVNGVVVRGSDDALRTIGCRVVVDATGQQTLLANKFGLKEMNPNLKKAAIWGYWRGALRGEGDNDGATIIMHTESKDSWFWFIPLSRGITSIGVVADTDYLLKGRGKPEMVYQEEMDRCPGLKPRLDAAVQLGDLKTIKEFSYMTREHAGPGWVLVGDALGFIDPVYSSGVYFALEMGVRAADAIGEGFRKKDFSAQQLGSWTASFKEGVGWVRKLVDAFYNKEFSIGRFMKECPQHRGELTNLLIGRVFREGAAAVFVDMDASINRAKSLSSGMV